MYTLITHTPKIKLNYELSPSLSFPPSLSPSPSPALSHTISEKQLLILYRHYEGVDENGCCSELYSLAHQCPSQDSGSVGSKSKLQGELKSMYTLSVYTDITIYIYCVVVSEE